MYSIYNFNQTVSIPIGKLNSNFSISANHQCLIVYQNFCHMCDEQRPKIQLTAAISSGSLTCRKLDVKTNLYHLKYFTYFAYPSTQSINNI